MRENPFIVTRLDFDRTLVVPEPNNYELARLAFTSPDNPSGLRDDDGDGVPNLAYVTGTGAHDHIRLTVSPTDPDEVIVTVVPYYNAARTIPTFRDGVPFDDNVLKVAHIETAAPAW